MTLAIKWIKATEAQLAAKNLNEEEEQAIIKFFELAADEPKMAIEIALQVLEYSPQRSILNCLGAGPLEDVLVKHPHCLDELIALAETNEKLRQCLSHVNLSEDNLRGANLLKRFLESKGYRCD